MFSAFSFVYDEIPGIRSVVSPGRQSEAAAPGENRSAPHAHTQIAHRSRDLAMPQCLRDRCQRHIFRLEKIRGEGSTDRMRRDRFARRDARRIPGPCSVPATAPVSGRSQTKQSFVCQEDRNAASGGSRQIKRPNRTGYAVPYRILPLSSVFGEIEKQIATYPSLFRNRGKRGLGIQAVSRFIIPFT